MKNFDYVILLNFFKYKSDGGFLNFQSESGFIEHKISCSREIKSTKDIRIIESKIEKIYNYDTITILDYKLLKEGRI